MAHFRPSQELVSPLLFRYRYPNHNRGDAKDGGCRGENCGGGPTHVNFWTYHIRLSGDRAG